MILEKKEPGLRDWDQEKTSRAKATTMEKVTEKDLELKSAIEVVADVV